MGERRRTQGWCRYSYNHAPVDNGVKVSIVLPYMMNMNVIEEVVRVDVNGK